MTDELTNLTPPHLEGLIRMLGVLMGSQQQCDEAGTMIAVSRQALDELAGMIQALAALPGGGVGWREIDSIPRDGRRVELLSANGKTDAGNWYDFSEMLGSSSDIQDHLNTDNGEGNYTHWRPLTPTPNPHEADRNA